MTILGIHHITIVNRDAERAKDFYGRVLGLTFLGRTADEAGGSERLYFGDEHGSAGSIVACSIQPQARRGLHGIGGTHHFALAAPDYDALLMWKRRLTDLGEAVRGPYDRNYFKSIYMDDPDGGVVEIATAGPGFAVDEPEDALGREDRQPPDEAAITGRSEDDIKRITWGEPVPEITPEMALSRGMHHITAIGSNIGQTHDFFGGLLGMPLVKRTFNFDDLNSRHWYWGIGGGKPGTIITYFERDPQKTRIAVAGAGTARHFALAVADEQALETWRDTLREAGIEVTDADGSMFKAIEFKDPDGQIVQLACGSMPPTVGLL
jgi:glyoxalase family protein